jgi:SAM-dependent methyltransferase
MAEPWQLQLFRRSFKKKLTVRALLEALPPVEGRRCLELGCATGLTSHFLRQRGGSWVSCDFERDHVASARRLLGEGVVLTSETEIPFKDASFDVVVAINFLEHLEDDARYFREMARVLRSSGILVMMAPKGEKGRVGYAVKRLLGLTAEQGGFSHARDGYSAAAAGHMLEAAGLRVLSHSDYSRFFTELLEDVMNYAYHRKAKKVAHSGGTDFHGTTAPMSEKALHGVGFAYRVYSAVHPILKLWTYLDLLIPWSAGYMLVIRGQKPAA